ncbi:MAG: protein kinase domain-containing protein [Myxococcota bacterium]
MDGHDLTMQLDARLVAARPEEDAVRRAVRLARVSSALFGAAEEVRVGRYQLLRELGRGGGGSVFAGRDPELHRDVALKLISCASPAHRQRALAEARTLARLSHPHVVPVHDVGETGAHVYLVMEQLSGPSLRDFAAGPATVASLVDAYRQAALGLAAAHAAGLVHRDFKPDNALFGADGRVHVVDFGLATESAEGTLAGTPGYMAPEQRTGGPAVDQYSLGRSLEEALRGRVVSRRVGRVLARATAPTPEARFPSMRALADALADATRPRWPRRLLMAVVATLAAGSFVAGRTAEVCDGGPAVLADAWSLARVDAVGAHLAALGTPLSTALLEAAPARLRTLGEEWLRAHRGVCEQHRRAELSDAAFDRATACLGLARAGMGAVTELLTRADGEALPAAHAALMALESPQRCAAPHLLAGGPPALDAAGQAVAQQHEVALVHTRAATGEAQRLAADSVEAARTLGHRRLLARALLTLGHARLQGDVAGAVTPLHEALLTALADGADALAVEAWARHAWARGRSGGVAPARALEGRELMTALSERTGSEGAFARALLFNNAGSLEATAGLFDAARADFREAVALSEGIGGPQGAELATALSNLASLTPERAERARLHGQALERLRTLVGPEHAQTLDKQMTASFDLDEPSAAQRALRELCPRLARLHPALKTQRERCALELAWQSWALGEAEGVQVAASLVSLPPLEKPDGPAGAVAVYLALVEGRDVRSSLEALRREASRPRGDEWYHHLYAADAELVLAAAAGGDAEAGAAAARADRHVTAALERTGLPYGVLLRRQAHARSGRWSR